jgi:hypothetical protein
MGKRGPAPKGEFTGQSAVLSTRIRPDTRAALEAASAKSGRSLSQEIEYRLRNSFLDDKRIEETFGSRANYAVMRMIASVADAMMNTKHRSAEWSSDPYLFDQVVKATVYVLDLLRPPGDVPTDVIAALDYGGSKQWKWRAAELLREIREVDPGLPVTEKSKDRRLAVRLKQDLGEMAERAELPYKPSAGTEGWEEESEVASPKRQKRPRK